LGQGRCASWASLAKWHLSNPLACSTFHRTGESRHSGGDLLGEPKQEGLSLPSQWWNHPYRLMGPLFPQLGTCRNTLLGGSRIWNLSLEKRSLPNRRIGVSGTTRNKWQKWMCP
jgi:hypothetical protein